MNIAQLFLRYNFCELSWIKMKNFLLIILNNLSSIYDPFVNKNFFYSIRLKNCISYSEYWIEQYSRCIKIAHIIFEFNWIKTELKKLYFLFIILNWVVILNWVHDCTENANIIFRFLERYRVYLYAILINE